jgi:hypothetical protein
VVEEVPLHVQEQGSNPELRANSFESLWLYTQIVWQTLGWIPFQLLAQGQQQSMWSLIIRSCVSTLLMVLFLAESNDHADCSAPRVIFPGPCKCLTFQNRIGRMNYNDKLEVNGITTCC